MSRWRHNRMIVALLAAALTFAGCAGGSSRSSGPQRLDPGGGANGPGMKPQEAATLQLPVPRTFDLTHVQPAHLAAALGNDPVRLFNFVRDAIGYEAYSGLLRGPRGTLLAMAGNSVDRALLLGTMLAHAGQRIRYARGTLSGDQATTLVTSMWIDRGKGQAAQNAGSRSPAIRAVLDGIMPALDRYSALIRDQLKQGGQRASLDTGPSVEALIRKAQEHYWVQWLRDGTWVDLDSSFADATPGRSYAKAEEVLDGLPEAMAHRVRMTVRLEEYVEGAPSTREVLTFAAVAADLSGTDVVAAHMPEHWTGPVTSIQGGIKAAIEDTGRIKPVLLVGVDAVVGEPFQTHVQTTGLGGLRNLLSGTGGRNGARIATGEWLDCEFIAPDGSRSTVTRELYDVVGPFRRARRQVLSAEELQRVAERGPDVSQNVYSLFFTTGRIQASHLEGLSSQTNGPEEADVLTALRRFSVLFTVLSDSAHLLGEPGKTRVTFYQDAPRLMISEFSVVKGRRRLGIDLRRDYALAAALGPQPKTVINARIFRGVLDGTLEWALMQYAIAVLREADPGWQTGVGTLGVFEGARRERIDTALLPRDAQRLAGDVAPDTLARTQAETASGALVVAPRRPVSIEGTPRFAWWRVIPESGEVTAVTDEGLHQVVVEYQIQHDRETGKVRIIYREVVNGQARPWGQGPPGSPARGWFDPGSPAWDRILTDFRNVMQGAINVATRGLY